MFAGGIPTVRSEFDSCLTICEVASDLGIPHHVLRFWETKFAQLRSVRGGSGQRFYRLEDVDFLRGIRDLLYGKGYAIKDVQKILKDRGKDFIIAVGQGKNDLKSSCVSDVSCLIESPDICVEDRVLGYPRVPDHHRFLSFKKDKDKIPTISVGHRPALLDDDRNLLQEAVCDLLECKRLLDHVR
ncbi:MerR family transcriptional regulator [Candidatus Liberibacter sp.]|uniref:MerR family transcriptional regulator n=1 Tax=Candidatus Liberibacter sp. TaxID=34022 RepID=UPI0015F7344A|nr:MerR family transcriptional regulator [Candidatus Liberibacter sp.]MBA5724196.1 MerR family transcriptional regulator [Candidatus Liberibacter sp.]